MKHSHTYATVTPATLQARLDSGEPLVVVDVLPADHFRAVHLPSAVNACVYEVTFLDQIRSLGCDSSQRIILYGAGANSLDSRTAAEKMLMAGYGDITVLEGGLERWRQEGFPLQGESGEYTAPPTTLADGLYRIDTMASTIVWSGRNPNSRHYGTVNIADGSLTVEGEHLQGSFSVEMESISNLNLAGDPLQQVLESHLKSDDFFFVDAFPVARFAIRAGRFSNQGSPSLPNCEITGTLELKGVQHEVSFAAILQLGLDGHLHLTANFDLDRTLWGVTYGSSRYYEHLGMHLVYDLISIDLQLVATGPETA